MICREEIEPVRRDRDQKQVVALDPVEQGQKKCPFLKKMLDSFAGWEEV